MEHYNLLTIGYEGLKIDEFIERLKKFKVTRLIDVRDRPLSRKAGFSKSVLRERLENERIEYVHVKSLGSPADIREKLKQDGDYGYFFEEYSRHLSKNLDAIELLHQFLYDGVNCIMCFERSAEKCHRSVVANKIKEHNGNGLKIKNI